MMTSLHREIISSRISLFRCNPYGAVRYFSELDYLMWIGGDIDTDDIQGVPP